MFLRAPRRGYEAVVAGLPWLPPNQLLYEVALYILGEEKESNRA